MKIQLHSIDHAPRHLPYWQTLMDDLCQPSPHEVAKVLGLSERTVYRYNATGFAPRVVCLAVFWLTSWGRNAVHTQAHNDAVMMAGPAQSGRPARSPGTATGPNRPRDRRHRVSTPHVHPEAAPCPRPLTVWHRQLPLGIKMG